MTQQNIIENIENYLKYDRVFYYVLKKNPNIFVDKLSSINFKDYWFEYEQQDIIFTDLVLFDNTTNDQGDLFYVYISDFNFKGSLCYSDNDYKEHKIDVDLKATIRVFKNLDFDIDISNKTNQIEIWDANQKIINLSFYAANKKLSGLDLIPYDYGYYTEIWSKIDKTFPNQNKQSYVTSYYYLQEIIECYERIKHLLSVVLYNETYSNNYTKRKTEMPPGYNSNYMFQIGDNFMLYDRYYLLYSELTIESFYKFWERVGFYLFQFLKPSSNQVNDRNLSLFKLIKELKLDYISNSYLQNQHFDWFDDFVLTTNSDFDKLTKYRHPLIHFKVDDITGRGIGSLIATVLNNWNENMYDESKLNTIENENKQISTFLLNQFDKCKTGYEHMIELIKKLPDLQ